MHHSPTHRRTPRDHHRPTGHRRPRQRHTRQEPVRSVAPEGCSAMARGCSELVGGGQAWSRHAQLPSMGYTPRAKEGEVQPPRAQEGATSCWSCGPGPRDPSACGHRRAQARVAGQERERAAPAGLE